MKAEIGILEEDRKKIADGLSRPLADSYILYLKTHDIHWNLEGLMFNTLHQMFMAQYTELWIALDLIAERNRALGFYVPGSYKKYSQVPSIAESEEAMPAKCIIKQLLERHEAISNRALMLRTMLSEK